MAGCASLAAPWNGETMNTNAPSVNFSADLLLRNAADGVFVLNRDREFILFNEACVKITGCDRIEMSGGQCQCCRALGGAEGDDPASCPADDVFGGSARTVRRDVQIRRKDGSHVWVEAVYSPVQNGSGRVDHVLGVIRDLTGTKAREEDLLRQLSAVDRKVDAIRDGRAVQGSPEPVVAEPSAVGSATCDQDNGGGLSSCRPIGAGPAEAKSYLLDPTLAQVERDAIRRALRAANWQRNKAARLMGISRSRLYRRMEALGIDPNEHV